MEPRYLARKDALVEQYAAAKSRDLAGDDLEEVARAVAEGKVATLLVDDNHHVPGRINKSSGEIEFEDLDHPEIDDVIDDLAELALKMGGQVVVLPSEQMPTKTGIAAIYRY
jgi:stalled ribosome rescue protein Dom34